MLFNSLVFLIFAAVFFSLWPLLRRHDASRWLLLTCASFLFYGWWDWRFLPLLIATGALDFLGGLAIDYFPQKRKLFLAFSLIANLSVLMLFKYLGFFAENLNALTTWTGHGTNFKPLSLVLPLGISFYTFESMSYVIDVYKGELKPTRNILHYFAFLSLFPHLIAGPIIRAADLLPQLKSWIKPTSAQRWEGLQLIAFGYFKKVVLADNLAPAVNQAFAATHLEASMPYWWVIMTMFAFQIYCDFSGYSDIARGLARWMGYDFPLNFNHPYIAKGFRDFWQRWHISLSSWFRDYVYIPLGGSRGGLWSGIGLMGVTMLISGLWHGAAWTFIIWGGLHAFYLAIERLTHWPDKLKAIIFGKLVCTGLTIALVWIAWVFFRATSLGQALEIVRHLFDWSQLSFEPLKAYQRTALPFLYIAFSIELFFYFGFDRLRTRQSAWVMVVESALVVMMITLSVFSRGPGGAFIYFQF